MRLSSLFGDAFGRLLCCTIVCGAPLLRSQSPPPPRGTSVHIRPDTAIGLPENLSGLLESGQGVYTYHETMTCGDILTGLTGSENDRIFMPLKISEGTDHTTVRMHGESGDADLYLSYGRKPTLDTYEYRPYVDGVREEIYLDQPASGQWWLMIHGFKDFKGVQISVSCIKGEFENSEEAYLEQQDLELALYYELSVLRNTNRTDNVTLKGQVLNRRGRQAYSAGRFDEALSIWTEWMETDPDNPRPVTLVGDLHLRAGDNDEAFTHYYKSLNMEPGQLSLMARLARLLDVQSDQPLEARLLLNRFSRLFPEAPIVALAQAEWLTRRKRYQEAIEIIRKVIENDPENLTAMSLLHPLLSTPGLRYANMLRMLGVGRLPGRETNLASAIRDNNLLTRPESWVLMDFLDEMAGKAPTLEERDLFSNLLPRDTISVEDFRIGRMSSNWVSSRKDTWNESGNLILQATDDQTEAFLRLVRSDAMHNGFIEAEIEDSRGFFWIYARRGEGNMIRFGFEETGQLYLQIWINNYLVTNETRMWSRMPGPAVLRLELRGDGAMGYINETPMFGSPVSIPDDMGLGWWGIAPWSVKPGRAAVSVLKISGGPLPTRLLILPRATLGLQEDSVHFRQHTDSFGRWGERDAVMNWLDDAADGVSTIAPEWYVQSGDGHFDLIHSPGSLELRLLARYHRLRLLPMVRIRSQDRLDIESLTRQALEDKVDGFTLVMKRMPHPEWIAKIEAQVVRLGLTLHLIVIDPESEKASFRELCEAVGIFSGPRRIQTLPLKTVRTEWSPSFTRSDPNSIILLEPKKNVPKNLDRDLPPEISPQVSIPDNTTGEERFGRIPQAGEVSVESDENSVREDRDLQQLQQALKEDASR